MINVNIKQTEDRNALHVDDRRVAQRGAEVERHEDAQLRPAHGVLRVGQAEQLQTPPHPLRRQAL